MFQWALLVLIPFLSGRVSADFDWDTPTALDDYVQGDDGFHSWTVLDKYEFIGVDLYILNMTSQKWMDESFTSRSVWWHWMGIAIPHDLEVEDHAFLGLIGGSNSDTENYPQEDDLDVQITSWFANQTKIVSAFILQIPNQPQVFVSDPEQDNRSEDNWIAWTWVEGLKSNGTVPEMIARFPMTKAAKRGLDTISQFIAEETGAVVDKFLVGGASKRGWTTWSLAATDQRVVGITPLVFTLFNMAEVLMHHYRTMDGAWSFALGPYWNVNLTKYLLDPLADVLYDYEDMYRYKPRLTMPKLIISGTGDEFFFLSDTHYWWGDFPGENRFMMNPNAEHILFPHWIAIARNLVVFTKALIRGVAMPQVTWERSQEEGRGRVVMTTDTQPLSVTGFRGETLDNHTRRDFRLFMRDEDGEGLVPQRILFTREDVTEIEIEDGFQYELYTDAVDDVWAGQFIQAEFEGLDDFDFRFTTEVNVIPDTFPREPCSSGDECYGYLV